MNGAEHFAKCTDPGCWCGAVPAVKPHFKPVTRASQRRFETEATVKRERAVLAERVKLIPEDQRHEVI